MSVGSFEVEKEMALTHREFLRGLPAALGSSDFRREGRHFVFEAEGRRLDIQLAPESKRQIGQLSIPTTHIRLVFSGYDENAVRDLLAQFDRAYHRGGG